MSLSYMKRTWPLRVIDYTACSGCLASLIQNIKFSKRPELYLTRSSVSIFLTEFSSSKSIYIGHQLKKRMRRKPAFEFSGWSIPGCPPYWDRPGQIYLSSSSASRQWSKALQRDSPASWCRSFSLADGHGAFCQNRWWNNGWWWTRPDMLDALSCKWFRLGILWVDANDFRL